MIYFHLSDFLFMMFSPSIQIREFFICFSRPSWTSNRIIGWKRDSSYLTKGLSERLNGWFSRLVALPVVIHLRHLILFELAYQVIFRVVSAQFLLVIFSIVHPFKLDCPCSLIQVTSEVCQRAHLGIYEGVSEDKLFVFQHSRSSHLSSVRYLIPLWGDGWLLSLVMKTLFKRWELMDESSSNF